MVVRFSSETFRAFEDRAADDWAIRAARSLRSTFPLHYDAMGASEAELTQLTRDVAAWAGGYGVKGDADVSRLCIVSVALGHRFWQDPRFQGYVAASLGNTSLHASRRAQAMVRSAKEWLRRLWTNDGMDGFARRLTTAIRQGARPDVTTIGHILPGHRRLFSAADNERLIGLVLERAPTALGHSAPQRLAHVSCALIHGVTWLDDPQYPRLRAAVLEANDAAALADDIATIYAEAVA